MSVQHWTLRYCIWRQAVVICAVMLCLAGCAKESGEVEQAEAGHRQEHAAGEIAVVVEVDRVSFDITETGVMTVEVRTPEGWRVVMPELPAVLEQYTLAVVETRRDNDALDAEGRVVRTIHYELEGVVVGTHTIGAMTMTAGPKGDEGGQEIVCEPIAVDVLALAASVDREEGETEERALRDIKGNVALAGPVAWGLWIILALVVAGVIVATVLLWRRRRRQRELRREYRPAHDIALEGLRRLELERLVQTGQVKAHYEQLSGVLRRYIEHRFLLEAPEQTTEEFLAAAYGDVTLSEEHRALLREFLEHCDLVKFARYAPQQEQIERSNGLAERFVHITRSTEALVDVTDGLPGVAVVREELTA